MNEKLLRVIMADDCIGVSIPYPIAKQMAWVSLELKSYLEEMIKESQNG